MVKFDKKYRHIYINRAKQFRLFGQKHYNIAKKVNGWEGLTEQCKESYSAVVIGSDQLWRSANIAGGFYTLEFVPDEINKIAYATSFGLDHVVDQQKEKAKLFLKRINHISVREASGQKIVKELLGRSIPVVNDPTLLLKPDKWDKYIPQSPIIEGKYIFCYFLGTNTEHWEFVKRLKKKTRIKIVGVPYGEKYKKGATDFLDVIPESIGPFEFVNLIKNATYICTDSFHGCAFSINYNKNLFAFYKFAKKGKMSTNSRIDNLLAWTGLSHRIMTGNEKIESNMLGDIEYSDVNKRLDSMRQMSLQYLITSLENTYSTDLE